MQITVLAFGKVAGITGENVLVQGQFSDTDGLQKILQEQFPGLAGLNYSTAVNKKLIQENSRLDENSIVALLPPFSGG